MSEEEIRDPRSFRWVESGISGLAREREWDALCYEDLPELEASALDYFEFRALDEATAIADGDIPASTLERAARRGREELDPPFEASVVRQNELAWLIGIRQLDGELVRLPEVEAASLTVARSPGGETVALVDGKEPADHPASATAALADLEQRGRERFQSFAVRADRVDGERWLLTIDPL